MENLNPIKLFLNRIYYYFFVERFNKKLNIDFPENIKRWDLIQNIIDKKNTIIILKLVVIKINLFSKIKLKIR